MNAAVKAKSRPSAWGSTTELASTAPATVEETQNSI